MNGNLKNLQSLTGKIKSFRIDTTLTKKGMCAESKAVGDALAAKVNISDIIDDLLSVASDKPLSANQGRLLKKLIDEIDPHYAENVLYNDTNVKDALDKVSNAENIAYDDEKSVQGAIDELKGTIGYSKKNFLKNINITSAQTKGGVTCTPNTDGSFTLNGTCTTDAFFNINYNESNAFDDGEYILSGGTSGAWLEVIIDDNVALRDKGEDVNFTIDNTTNNWARIFVDNGTVLDNVTVYPMVRPSHIENDTYMPYVEDVQTQLDSKAAKNDLKQQRIVESSSTYTNKPWLVIKTHWNSFPIGTTIQQINCGTEYSVIVFKLNNSYGKALVISYGDNTIISVRRMADGFVYCQTNMSENISI